MLRLLLLLFLSILAAKRKIIEERRRAIVLLWKKKKSTTMTISNTRKRRSYMACNDSFTCFTVFFSSCSNIFLTFFSCSLDSDKSNEKKKSSERDNGRRQRSVIWNSRRKWANVWIECYNRITPRSYVIKLIWLQEIEERRQQQLKQ